MKMKKTIAAIAALMMTVSSVSALPTAAADDPATDNTAVENTSAAPAASVNTVETRTAAAEVISAEDYAQLDSTNKANYVPVTVTESDEGRIACFALVGSESVAGKYVKKGTEVYVGVSVIGVHPTVYINGKEHSTILQGSVDEPYCNYAANYTVAADDTALVVTCSDENDRVISAAVYNSLTAEEKSCFTPVNISGPIEASTFYGNDYTEILIEDGNYVNKYYPVFFWAAEGATVSTININGTVYYLEEGETKVQLWNWEYDSIDVSATQSAVISAEDYAALDSAEQANYVPITIQEPLRVAHNSYFIYSGNYVKKGTLIEPVAYFDEGYTGEYIYVNGEPIELRIGYDDDYIYGQYTVDGDEVSVTASQKRSLTSEEYEALPEAEKADYIPLTKSGCAYATHFIIQDEYEIFYHEMSDGDYILKDDIVAVGIWKEDYSGQSVYVNGDKVNLVLNGSGAAYVSEFNTNYFDAFNIKVVDAVRPTPAPSPAPSRPSESSPGIVPSTASGAPVVSPSKDPAPAKAAPTPAAVAKSLDKTGKTKVSYDATEAGVTKDILEAFNGNDSIKQLTAKLDGFKVKITRGDITDAKKLDDIDLTLSDKKILSKKQISKLKSLKDSEKVIQLNFSGEQELNGLSKVTLQASAGKKFAGREAVVYEVVGNKLKFVCRTKVDANGYVSFKTDHLGKFIVSVK